MDMEWVDAKAVESGIIVNGVFQPWGESLKDGGRVFVCTSYGPERVGDPEEDWRLTSEPFPDHLVVALPLEACLREYRVWILRFKHGYTDDREGGWSLPREIVEFLQGPRQQVLDDGKFPWDEWEDGL